ncbi:MAG: DUF1207 domain-containing protein [Elusimicrobia bacterium]|nr:DUF1207 domain-containing protein [Elusimicrobiota bacterium]
MRVNAAALALALLAPAAWADSGLDLLPKSDELFAPLLADPRQVQLLVSYYRLEGQDASDVALGHAWGLARWRTDDEWFWQWDVEGMAYSRFKLGGGVNEFETVDFFANLPLVARKDGISLKVSLFHESSHLGDDYIRATGNQGFRYSVEGARAQASWEPARFARLYGGAIYLLHTVPSPSRWSLQSGLELTTDDLGWSPRVPTRLFLAQDLQWHQRVRWNMDSRTVAGVKIGPRRPSARALRVQLGYFDGHSPFGQFFSRREHHAEVSLAFEL